MAVESANYQCPSCGGVLRYFTGAGELRCDYCDSSFTVAEVEAAFAPRLERADSRMTDTLPPTGPTHDVAPMRTYTCASCAAELVCDATTAITECPYCGNQAVVPGVLVDEFRPDLVIPFKLDKAAAVSALSAHYKGKRFLPGAFAANNRIDKIEEITKYTVYLKEKGIGTIIHYPIPPHLSEAYRYLGKKRGDYPIAERYADEVLSLPMYNGMTEEEQTYVIEAINAWEP